MSVSEGSGTDTVDSATDMGNRFLEQQQAWLDLDGQGLPPSPCQDESSDGFFSNLFRAFSTTGRNNVPANNLAMGDVRRTIATQTEEQDPITIKGQQLSYLIIQELAMNRRTRIHKDQVYESLASCVCEILEKHTMLFNGMANRIDVTHYYMFASIANELFEANANNETHNGEMRITWGRVITLFAFAVRLSQEYREDQRRVDAVTRFLTTYVTKHVISFVREEGGWESLVEQFPPTTSENDAQVKKALLWSGLCVGLVATMYATSLFKHH